MRDRGLIGKDNLSSHALCIWGCFAQGYLLRFNSERDAVVKVQLVFHGGCLLPKSKLCGLAIPL